MFRAVTNLANSSDGTVLNEVIHEDLLLKCEPSTSVDALSNGKWNSFKKNLKLSLKIHLCIEL